MTSKRRFHAPTLAIIDYGLGNLRSIRFACEAVGIRCAVTADPGVIRAAEAAILPGVGAFDAAMSELHRRGLDGAVLDFARSGRPLLGICLGMQLLMSRSEEFGDHAGLDIVAGRVAAIPGRAGDGSRIKVPHVGWAAVHATANGPASSADHQSIRTATVREGPAVDSGIRIESAQPLPHGRGSDRRTAPRWERTLLAGCRDGEQMYFAHSFVVIPEDETVAIGQTSYAGVTFCSALQSANVFGCQFHPERSGPAGLRVYRSLAARLHTAANPKEADLVAQRAGC